ncbi:MAG: hypothetical protein QF645_08535, partial [Planctomycetota bacterium]|nr:hypothetical protein [Planctomycetota bacterium]
MALLVNLGLACAGVEEGFVEESGDTFVSKQLQLRWMQEVDSSDRPILSFLRKSDPPTVLDRNLVFRAQPPLAIPGGVLCARNGDLVYLHAGTGEEIWSYPVSNNDWLQISFLGDRIAVYEGGGQLIILNVEGKKIGSFEVMSDSILDSDGEHVYLLSRDGIQACSLSDMQVLWARASSKKLRFHSMITGNRKIAVGYFQHSIQTQEVALLDRRTGLTRHRFMGRGIGWSDHSFFTLQEQGKEVWEWRDVSGAFLRRHQLNSFVDGEILCYKGDLIYSVENRYFSAGVTHIGRGGQS